ncbi:D-amino-acid transaminase [Sesbania bispinosa]|nr:D-amino-acid transaminase [Sesbania bispinosa]
MNIIPPSSAKPKVRDTVKEAAQTLGKESVLHDKNASWHKYGIQTAMHVKVLGPNRMRFLEDNNLSEGVVASQSSSTKGNDLERKLDYMMHDEEHEQMLELLDQTLKIQPSPG